VPVDGVGDVFGSLFAVATGLVLVNSMLLLRLRRRPTGTDRRLHRLADGARNG
jgi:hypothetical protein